MDITRRKEKIRQYVVFQACKTPASSWLRALGRWVVVAAAVFIWAYYAAVLVVGLDFESEPDWIGLLFGGALLMLAVATVARRLINVLSELSHDWLRLYRKWRLRRLARGLSQAELNGVGLMRAPSGEVVLYDDSGLRAGLIENG